MVWKADDHTNNLQQQQFLRDVAQTVGERFGRHRLCGPEFKGSEKNHFHLEQTSSLNCSPEVLGLSPGRALI